MKFAKKKIHITHHSTAQSHFFFLRACKTTHKHSFIQFFLFFFRRSVDAKINFVIYLLFILTLPSVGQYTCHSLNCTLPCNSHSAHEPYVILGISSRSWISMRKLLKKLIDVIWFELIFCYFLKLEKQPRRNSNSFSKRPHKMPTLDCVTDWTTTKKKESMLNNNTKRYLNHRICFLFLVSKFQCMYVFGFYLELTQPTIKMWIFHY